MGANTKDQTPDLRHSMCRDPNGSWEHTVLSRN